MKQRLLLTAILFVACSISVEAQESRWSLKPNGGITVATLSGDEVECHFALYNLLKDDKVKHIPWSEMLSSLTGKSVKSRYLQLTVGYRFNL